MRVRLLPLLVLSCSCSEHTGLSAGGDAAASPDGRPGADGQVADVAPRAAEADAAADSASDARSAMEARRADLAAVEADAAMDPIDLGPVEVAPVEVGPVEVGPVEAGAEAGPVCQVVVPAPEGDTVGWMAGQCGWTAPPEASAPAVAITLADVAEPMSFRVRVDIHPETYAHQGYVSVPTLTEVGPFSHEGMAVVGPTAGTRPGQYFFDLRWANQVAPTEGMQLTLTARFSFACSPAMSRTIPTSTSAELLLCLGGGSSFRGLVWRAAGEACDICRARSPIDAGTD